MSILRRLSGSYYTRKPDASDPAATTPVASSSTAPSSTLPTSLPTAPRRRQVRIPYYRFSRYSTQTISEGAWCAPDFMLGVGMVIFQPSTHKVVICYDAATKEFFLPKGRKDAGESPETGAIREAYEESGYRTELLPLYIPSNATLPEEDPARPYPPLIKTTEPIFVYSHTYNPPARRNFFTWRTVDTSRVYFVQWYAGQIPHDAVRDEHSTTQPDETKYTSFILPFEEALNKLPDSRSRRILAYAWTLYCETVNTDNAMAEAEAGGSR